MTVVVSEAGQRATLRVHNEGAPIPPHAQAKIFEPLARGSADTTHNLGLGLFIARAFVIAHGGDIRVDSTEQSGTTFEVTLPR